jgi:hypothetical protein
MLEPHVGSSSITFDRRRSLEPGPVRDGYRGKDDGADRRRVRLDVREHVGAALSGGGAESPGDLLPDTTDWRGRDRSGDVLLPQNVDWLDAVKKLRRAAPQDKRGKTVAPSSAAG